MTLHYSVWFFITHHYTLNFYFLLYSLEVTTFYLSRIQNPMNRILFFSFLFWSWALRQVCIFPEQLIALSFDINDTSGFTSSFVFFANLKVKTYNELLRWMNAASISETEWAWIFHFEASVSKQRRDSSCALTSVDDIPNLGPFGKQFRIGSCLSPEPAFSERSLFDQKIESSKSAIDNLVSVPDPVPG